MIHTVNGLHVEDGHDIIAIYDMLRKASKRIPPSIFAIAI